MGLWVMVFRVRVCIVRIRAKVMRYGVMELWVRGREKVTEAETR